MSSTTKEMSLFEVILKKFDTPDKVRDFEKDRFELLHIGGMTIGRATYLPGWKWSAHLGKALGKMSCDVEHVGLVIAGPRKPGPGSRTHCAAAGLAEAQWRPSR